MSGEAPKMSDADVLRQDLDAGGLDPVIRRRLHSDAARFESPDSVVGDIVTMGGVAPAMGKGIADSAIGLMRGVHWLGSFVGLDHLVKSEDLPKSIYDLLPKDAGRHLASRIGEAGAFGTAGEIAGQVISFLPTGGAAGLASLPGKAVSKLSAPGLAAGAKLAQIPQVAKWGQSAKLLEPIIGGSTGFGLYNLMTAEGGWEERKAAMLHGMVAGGALAIAGAAANAAEKRLLDKMLSPEQAKSMAAYIDRLSGGEIPTWGETLSTLKGKAAAKAVGAAIEGAGFAMLDDRFFKAAMSGDIGTAAKLYAESLPAALLARTGDRDAYLFFRRQNPELNTVELRQQVLETRKGEDVPRGTKGDQQLPQGKIGPRNDQAKPLLDAGWEIPDGVPPEGRFQLEFPGSGKVSMLGDGTLEVPASVFQAVRGEKPSGETVALRDELADEFLRDLSAVSMMRRMGGELQFGGQEAWAGGPWKKDGALYTVGLDGHTYTKSFPARDGEAWQPTSPMLVDITAAPDTPSLQSWQKLAVALRKTAEPSVGLDLIDAAVTTAINGAPESKSVAELRKFFDAVPPEQLAQALDPQSIVDIGMTLGRIGSGHSTAERALMKMREADPTEPQRDPSPEETDIELQHEIEQMLVDERAERSDMARYEEAGFVDVGAIAETATATGAKVKEVAKRSADYLFENQAEVIRKAMPQSDLSARTRKALSEGREIRGEAQARWIEAEKALKKIPKGTRDQWLVWDEAQWRPAKAGEAGEVKLWELLADNRIKGADELQQAAAKSLNAINEYLYEGARMAGVTRGVLGNPQAARPLPQAKRYVTERKAGKDVDEVMGDAEKRRSFFKSVIEHPLNEGVRITGEFNRKRKVTVDDLEKDFMAQKEARSGGQDVEAAFEHMRLFPHVPMNWKAPDRLGGKIYEMREHNVSDVFADVINSQSRRIASVKQFGQDMSDPQKAAVREFLSDPANAVPPQQADAVLSNLEKLGPSGEVKQFREQLYSDAGPKISASYKDALVNRAEQMLEATQGRYQKASQLSRAVRSADILPRAFGTMKAWTWDVVEGVAALPVGYAGVMRALKANAEFWKSPMGAVRQAWREGSVTRQMGELIWGEGSKPLQQLANLVGKPGEFVEWLKGGLFSKTADVILGDWAAGRVQAKDAGLLNELRFSPEDQQALLSGKAGARLQAQFRNEFVQLLSGRREKGEGSAFADNPDAQAWIRYGRWSSARIGQLIRSAKDVVDARSKHGTFSRQSLEAMGRHARLLGTFTVGGVGGLYIGMLVSSLLSGDPDRGHASFVRQASDDIGWFAARALFRQAVVGPTGQVISTLGDSSDARAIASLSVPTQLAYSVGKAVAAANRGDLSALSEFMSAQGYVPLGSDLRRFVPRAKEWLEAAFSGEALSTLGDAISDHDLLNEFRTRPGSEKGFLGLPMDPQPVFPRRNDPAFYDHMKDAMTEFYRASAGESDTEKAATKGLDAALAALEKARSVEGVKQGSIASYIRAQKHFDNISFDDKVKFLEYAGEERMSRMMTHDHLLDQFARAAQKVKGEPIGDEEWSTRVDHFRQLINTGTVDNETVTAAVDHAKMAFDTSRAIVTTRLEGVARAIASSDYATMKVFDGDLGRALVTVQDHATRSFIITQQLLKRAVSQSASDTAEELRRSR